MPKFVPLSMYGQPGEGDSLGWDWVEHELTTSGTYWVIPSGSSAPHPRPVWGIWAVDSLHVSIGSPTINRLLAANRKVVVHLPSGTDVVIVEGVVAGHTHNADLIATYDRKYDWTYDVDDYGPLLSIRATSVLSWRATGPAGRDGFGATGSWRFDT